MARSRIVRNFMVVRIFVICGLAFLVGAVALLFYFKMEEQVVAYGVVEPQNVIEVRGDRSTTVFKVLVKQGQVVAKDDLLIQFDSNAEQNELAQAEDRLKRAQSQLEVQQVKLEYLTKNPLPEKLLFAAEELAYAKATLDLSKSELDRNCKLLTKGLISQSQWGEEQAKHQAVVNRFQLAERKQQLVSSGLKQIILKEATTQIKLAQCEVTNLQHEVKRWREKLDNCTPRASAAGQVVAIYKRDGESVKPGELLLAVTPDNRTQLRLFVDEKEIYKIGVGQKAWIRSSVYSYRKYGTCRGTVSDVAVWAANEETNKREYIVLVSVEDAPFPLLLGSTAQAYIVVAYRGLLDMLLDRY